MTWTAALRCAQQHDHAGGGLGGLWTWRHLRPQAPHQACDRRRMPCCSAWSEDASAVQLVCNRSDAGDALLLYVSQHRLEIASTLVSIRFHLRDCFSIADLLTSEGAGTVWI